mgnify:FL=1
MRRSYPAPARHRRPANPAAKWRKEPQGLARRHPGLDRRWPEAKQLPRTVIHRLFADALNFAPVSQRALFDEQHRKPVFGKPAPRHSPAHPGADDDDIPMLTGGQRKGAGVAGKGSRGS